MALTARGYYRLTNGITDTPKNDYLRGHVKY